jgi:hypothetical protein
MISRPTSAECPASSGFALQALDPADAKAAAEVVRAAFSAQSRPSEAAARERGARRMRLRVRLALPENERLFERFGFVRRSLEAQGGFDASTAAVMEKPLS